MRFAAAVLTAVATLLCHKSVPVTCGLPPGMQSWGYAYGIAEWPPPHIYLRTCRRVIALEREDVVVFAHELLHIEHPGWSHRRVIPVSFRYARKVSATISRVKTRASRQRRRGLSPQQSGQ